MRTHHFSMPMAAAMIMSLGACLNVPAEVVKVHEKERRIIAEAERTHLALIDSFVDDRLARFESFYFDQYGPKYFEAWKQEFKKTNGRDFDAAKDFNLLHQDLVAHYLKKIQPVEKMRGDLKKSVQEAYAQYKHAHEATQSWLDSAKKLNDGQRSWLNKILTEVDPKLSLESIDQKIAEIQTTLKT